MSALFAGNNTFRRHSGPHLQSVVFRQGVSTNIGSFIWAAPPGTFSNLHTLSGVRLGPGCALPASLEALDWSAAGEDATQEELEALTVQLRRVLGLKRLTVRCRGRADGGAWLTPSFLTALPPSLQYAFFDFCHTAAVPDRRSWRDGAVVAGEESPLRAHFAAAALQHLKLAHWSELAENIKVLMISFQLWLPFEHGTASAAAPR